MRKLVLMMSVSLDGFIAGPNGELDWHLVDDELHSHFNQVAASMSVFMHGRVMYELMWAPGPRAASPPAITPPMVDFAKIWRETPKILYSKTLDRADWNSTIVRDVVA